MPLELATLADIDAICAIEQRPDNANRIGRWSIEQHAAHLARAHVRYFVARENGALAAFAILERIDDPTGWAYLRRLAVAAPAAGLGRRFLTEIIDWLFAETASQKLELRVRVGNPARRLYQRLGFTEDGIVANRPDQTLSHVMTLTRAAWRA